MKTLMCKRYWVAILITLGISLALPVYATDTSQFIGKDLDQIRDLLNAALQGRNYMVQVDQQGKIKQIVDTGANGDGSDAQKVDKQPPSAGNNATRAVVAVPANYQGQEAIAYLGADLSKVAGNYGLTAQKLKELLLQDDTARIDSNKRMFYIDHTASQHNKQLGTQPNTPGGTTPLAVSAGALPIASAEAQAQAFKLHSKPGASKTIYLDFVGYSVSDTVWSTKLITATAYDLSGNPAVFDSQELSNIISIWGRVAEDYIPFDVDVTTEAPTSAALLRESSADTTYGTRVVITKNDLFNCGCGGTAYVGVVSYVNNTSYQPAWVFQTSLASNEKYIAEAASHEAGHTLGLLHDGLKSGESYYLGHGASASASATGWAPIMGAGYYENVTQWDQGVYPHANNQQDDIATFAANGILPSHDDVGNSIASAIALSNIGSGPIASIKNSGVIETATDVDMYMINADAGELNLQVSPIAKGPNLDVQLTLYNAEGIALSHSAPAERLDASIDTTVGEGVYFLAVSGSDRNAQGTDYGYPHYGSLGQYAITGAYRLARAGIVAPVATITASVLGGVKPLAVSFSANDSIGNGNIVAYQWSFGDNSQSTEANPVHNFLAAGTYTVTLSVINEYRLANTSSVQITVVSPTDAVSQQ